VVYEYDPLDTGVVLRTLTSPIGCDACDLKDGNAQMEIQGAFQKWRVWLEGHFPCHEADEGSRE